MAKFNDGGGGGKKPPSTVFSGVPTALKSISKSVKSVGKSTAKASKRGYSSGGYKSSGYKKSYSPQPTYHAASPPRPAVGSTSKGTIAPSVPAPTKPPMSLQQWLAGDTSFQSQKTAYQKALADYAAQDQAERAKYGQEYTASLGKLNTEKGQGQQALNDDYASRGLMSSGLYADALNEFQNNFSTRQADLERARQAYLSDLTTDKTNFTTQQQLELKKAQDAAAARRAAQLGL